LVISVDNTEISERPDKWRIGQLLTMSAVLAIMLTVLSFAHFYIARDYFEVGDNELHSIMYLHISSGKAVLSFNTYSVTN
jgi:hypothetical protein